MDSSAVSHLCFVMNPLSTLFIHAALFSGLEEVLRPSLLAVCGCADFMEALELITLDVDELRVCADVDSLLFVGFAENTIFVQSLHYGE